MGSRLVSVVFLGELLALGAATPALAADATVTLNASQTYQTIEGLGAFGQSGADAKFLADDLGMSLARFQIPHTYCTGKGAYNPGAIDGIISRMNSLKNAGITRFIACPWTPPGWMKENCTSCGDGPCACGGNLKASALGDYADMMVEFCKAVKQRVGVDMWGVGIQNEPEFDEWYVSCKYTAEGFRDAVKALGPKLKAACPNVRIFGGETMLETGNAYIGITLRDTVARQYLKGIAFHGYLDGVRPTSSSNAAAAWTKVGGLAGTFKIHAMMTELSGFPATWEGAMNLAGNIYSALRYGNLSVWTWWHDCGGGGSTGDLESLLNPNGCGHLKRSLASKQFYKWIRPGAVRMEAKLGGDSAGVHCVAFFHSQDRTITMVMINSGTTQKSVSISGASCPSSLQMFRTSASDDCRSVGAVSATDITLAASSVNTLYATGYDAPTGVAGKRGPLSGNAAQSATSRSRLYDTAGRVVTEKRAAGPRIAVRCGAGELVAGGIARVTARQSGAGSGTLPPNR